MEHALIRPRSTFISVDKFLLRAISEREKEVLKLLTLREGVMALNISAGPDNSKIFQAILFGHKKQNQPSDQSDDLLKISISIKEKGQTNEKGLNIFSLRVTCNESVPFASILEGKHAPSLSRAICSMQAQENESHVSLQSRDEGAQNLCRTSVVWLESDTATNNVKVKILKERFLEQDASSNSSTVLYMRVFMESHAMIQCSQGICELMERVKFLNPQIQLSFRLDFGGTAKFDLSDSDSIMCDVFSVYNGKQKCRKIKSHFNCGDMHLACSKVFEIRKSDDAGMIFSVNLRCIVCFIPLSFIEATRIDENDKERKPKQTMDRQLPGNVRQQIQVYGPAGVPFDMDDVTESMSLHPDSLLPWHKFGLQVKTSFKCAAYDLHCTSRVTDRNNVPSWVASCDSFCLIFAFVVNKEGGSSGEDTLEVQQELFQAIGRQVLVRESLCKFHEAAAAAMSDLLMQDTLLCTTTSNCQAGLSNKMVVGDLYKKMVPDVVASLADIFMKSRNSEFRALVSSVVPTTTRMNMSQHLEKLLWGMVPGPVYTAKTDEDSPDLHVNKDEEVLVDDWKLYHNKHHTESNGSKSYQEEGPSDYDDEDIWFPDEDETTINYNLIDDFSALSFSEPDFSDNDATSEQEINALSFSEPDFFENDANGEQEISALNFLEPDFSENDANDEQGIEMWRQMETMSNIQTSESHFYRTDFPSTHFNQFPYDAESETHNDQALSLSRAAYESGMKEFQDSPTVCVAGQSYVNHISDLSSAKIVGPNFEGIPDEELELENLFGGDSTFQCDSSSSSPVLVCYEDRDSEYCQIYQYVNASYQDEHDKLLTTDTPSVISFTNADRHQKSVTDTPRNSYGSCLCRNIEENTENMTSETVVKQQAMPFQRMTRKRSSDYVTTNGCVEPVFEETHLSNADEIELRNGEIKRQRLCTIDSVPRDENQQTTFLIPGVDQNLKAGHMMMPVSDATFQLRSNPANNSGYTEQVDFNDWFDEGELANWYAEMI